MLLAFSVVVYVVSAHDLPQYCLGDSIGGNRWLPKGSPLHNIYPLVIARFL